MRWNDDGILISARRHGESAAIVEALTAQRGRHLGVVRGGAGRKMTPILQPGAFLALEWSARLEEHMGSFRVDPIRTPAARIMADPAALAALAAVLSLASVSLPEREAHPRLFAHTLDLIDALGNEADWPRRYAVWELQLLTELGFGLDLSQCAATGSSEDLIWVSPKTGRAVGREAGAPYASRLLGLPEFLRSPDAEAVPGDVADALRLTGFFLRQRLATTLLAGRLPEARDRAERRIVAVAAERERLVESRR